MAVGGRVGLGVRVRAAVGVLDGVAVGDGEDVAVLLTMGVMVGEGAIIAHPDAITANMIRMMISVLDMLAAFLGVWQICLAFMSPHYHLACFILLQRCNTSDTSCNKLNTWLLSPVSTLPQIGGGQDGEQCPDALIAHSGSDARIDILQLVRGRDHRWQAGVIAIVEQLVEFLFCPG